jgi:hypothetical protein
MGYGAIWLCVMSTLALCSVWLNETRPSLRVAAAAWQSMQTGVMDCRAGRHCEEQGDVAIAMTGGAVTDTVRLLLAR